MSLDANALLFLQETLTQNDGADVKALQTTFSENGVTSLDDFRKLSKEDLQEMKVPIGLRNRFLTAMTRLRPNNTIAPEGGAAAAQPVAPAPAPKAAPVPAPAPAPKAPVVAPYKPQPQPQPQPAQQQWVCPACTFRNGAQKRSCDTCGSARPAAAVGAAPRPVQVLATKKGAAVAPAGGAAAAGDDDDDDDDPFAQWRGGAQHQQQQPPPVPPHVHEYEGEDDGDVDACVGPRPGPHAGPPPAAVFGARPGRPSAAR